MLCDELRVCLVARVGLREMMAGRFSAAERWHTRLPRLVNSPPAHARPAHTHIQYRTLPSPPRPLQVGIPSSREQYIHRLGRTARAGRAGVGLLILMPEEQHFMRQLRGGWHAAPRCAVPR